MASIGRHLEIMQAVRQINRNLSRVAAAVEPAVKAKVLERAKLIADEMRSIAPVSHDADAGQLKRSIRVVEREASEKSAVRVQIKAGDKSTAFLLGAYLALTGAIFLAFFRHESSAADQPSLIERLISAAWCALVWPKFGIEIEGYDSWRQR